MRVMIDTNIFVSMLFFPSAQTGELAAKLTGDKDFLVLDIEMPEILTMKQFLEQY